MRKPASAIAVHGILILYTALALFPILLVIMNSFKARKAIFGSPLAFPTPSTFSLVGYDKVFGTAFWAGSVYGFTNDGAEKALKSFSETNIAGR